MRWAERVKGGGPWQGAIPVARAYPIGARFSCPAAERPCFNTGGPVDLSAQQSGDVQFLAGANAGLTGLRTGTAPTGNSLFFPLANNLNGYPCPSERGFEPDPGESMEHFLLRTGEDVVPPMTSGTHTLHFGAPNWARTSATRSS